MPRSVCGSASESWRARSNAAIAIARAVRSLQYDRPVRRAIAASAVLAYGTTASSTLADAPGTSNSAEIAPLPPPVTTSTNGCAGGVDLFDELLLVHRSYVISLLELQSTHARRKTRRSGQMVWNRGQRTELP